MIKYMGNIGYRVHAWIRTGMTVLAFSVTFCQLHAQSNDASTPSDQKQIAPPKPEKYFPEKEKKPEKPARKVSEADKVITPSLNGIVFVPSEEAVVKDGLETLDELKQSEEGIVALGFEIPGFEKLVSQLKKFMGKPLTRRIWVSEINRAIVMHYRDQDRPIVDVYSPVYKSREGVIQFILVESKFGELRIEGGKWFPEKYYRNQFRTKHGDIIRQSIIDDDIDWVNQNPFRRTDVILEQGAQSGTTDAVLIVDDRMPLRLFGGYNDAGNRLTGYGTFLAGFNWGRAFMGEQSLSYQHVRRSKATFFESHTFDYVKPLPWRHSFSLSYFYAEGLMDARRIGVTTLTDLTTRQWGVTGGYDFSSLYFPKSKKSKLRDYIGLKLSFNRSENGNSILGIRQPGRKVDVFDIALNYTIAYQLKQGSISVSNALIYSPGGIGGHSNKSASGFPGDTEYAVWNSNFNFSHSLPMGLSLNSSVRTQLASDQMVGSRIFSIGGVGSVRGYDSSEGSGDIGLIAQNNIYSPPMKLWNRFFPNALEQENLRLLAFVDYGKVEIKNATSTEDLHKALMSVGAGFRYNVRTNFDFSFDYGIQLRDSEAGQTQRNSRNRRAHISLNFSY